MSVMDNPIVADVIRLTCQEFGVPVAVLLGPQRLQQEVNARKVIASVLRELGFASREIATILGRNPSCSNMVNGWIGDCRVLAHLSQSAARILKAVQNRDLIAGLEARVAKLENALRVLKGDVDHLGHCIPDPCRRLVEEALYKSE
jgi:hypothetical protein